jgi:class 3 adenylate cyclase
MGVPVADLPVGTVTLLFTDIEGSTRLLRQLGDRYAGTLEQHRRLLRAAFARQGGREVDTQGDAFFVAFGRAADAVAAAVEAQRALAAHPWPDGSAVRVRMGLHTGEPTLAGSGYIGLDVHRAARLSAAGHGGQVLLSQTTRDLVEHELPAGVELRDLGEHRLRDLPHPERVFQLTIAGLPAEFPPLRTLAAGPNNLPTQLTSFIGREREMAEVKRLLAATRLLTLTGAGGAGKTRLALQVAADLLQAYRDGVWLVERRDWPSRP